MDQMETLKARSSGLPLVSDVADHLAAPVYHTFDVAGDWSVVCTAKLSE